MIVGPRAWRSPRVILAQSLRVFTLVALMPPFLALTNADPIAPAMAAAPATSTLAESVAVFAVSVGAAAALKRLGVPAGTLLGAMLASALLHVGTLACLAYVGVLLERGAAYFVGVGMIGLLLGYEHSIVMPSDLSRINKAFFDINGYVSVAFFACVLVDQLMR